jgi:phosphoribosyl-ATP pyrophosphohydrolase
MGYAKQKEMRVGDDGHSCDQITQLYDAIAERRHWKDTESRTAKLFAAGIPKMAQKLVEEAAEVAIEAVRGQRSSLKQESADLLYHLVVLWYALNIDPDEIWDEMRRREKMLGIAEKLPKRLARVP